MEQPPTCEPRRLAFARIRWGAPLAASILLALQALAFDSGGGALHVGPGPGYPAAQQAGHLHLESVQEGSLRIRVAVVPGGTLTMADVLSLENRSPHPMQVTAHLQAGVCKAALVPGIPPASALASLPTRPATIPAQGTLHLSLVIHCPDQVDLEAPWMLGIEGVPATLSEAGLPGLEAT